MDVGTPRNQGYTPRSSFDKLALRKQTRFSLFWVARDQDFSRSAPQTQRQSIPIFKYSAFSLVNALAAFLVSGPAKKFSADRSLLQATQLRLLKPIANVEIIIFTRIACWLAAADLCDLACPNDLHRRSRRRCGCHHKQCCICPACDAYDSSAWSCRGTEPGHAGRAARHTQGG
jgi:hypothetical protein